MEAQERLQVQERLCTLGGESLISAGYAADMLTLVFGPAQRESCLHIQCSYRLATEERILLDRIDYFEPSDALKDGWRRAGLEEADFPREWPDRDCRLFERVKQLPLDGMTVTAVQVNQLGDLTIRFANRMTLLALPMSSDEQECWRFWCDARWPDQHMVVCGDRVELHGPGDRCSRMCE